LTTTKKKRGKIIVIMDARNISKKNREKIGEMAGGKKKPLKN